jgi:hypothetical protein
MSAEQKSNEFVASFVIGINENPFDGMRPIFIQLALLLRSVLIKKIPLCAEVISVLILKLDLESKYVIRVINLTE